VGAESFVVGDPPATDAEEDARRRANRRSLRRRAFIGTTEATQLSADAPGGVTASISEH
jgi:hypothetical protein